MATEIGYISTRTETVSITPCRGSGEVYSDTHKEIGHQGYSVLGYCLDEPIGVLKKLVLNYKIQGYLDYPYGVNIDTDYNQGYNGLCLKRVGLQPIPGCSITSTLDKVYELLRDSFDWFDMNRKRSEIDISKPLDVDQLYQAWTIFIRMKSQWVDKNSKDFALAQFGHYDQYKEALPDFIQVSDYIFDTFLKVQPEASCNILDDKIHEIQRKLNREPQYTFYQNEINYLNYLKKQTQG